MEPQPDRLWTTDDLAGFLGVPVNTLYYWRSKGYGPAGRRVGKYVRFDPADVQAWFAGLEAA